MSRPTTPDAAGDLKLLSDDIRRRERRKRRSAPLWNVLSFLIHGIAFAVIVFCTPVKDLVFDEEEKKSDPAADLSAERIEQISDALSQARVNELLRQLDALQAVLHNMDLMKEELQQDYDTFAEKSGTDLKQTLARFIDTAETSQQTAVREQVPIVDTARDLLAEERNDLKDEARSRKLRDTSNHLQEQGFAKVDTAQANAGNALDRVQVQAEFAGFEKTATAAEKLRDAQIEAASMQRQAQKEVADIAYEMSRYFDANRRVEQTQQQIKQQSERLAKAEADLEKFKTEREQSEQARAEAEQKRNESEQKRNRFEQARTEAQNRVNAANRDMQQARTPLPKEATPEQREEAKRKQAQADERRRVAEAERRQAEQDRNQSERDRSQFERARQQAERQRNQADQRRDQANRAIADAKGHIERLTREEAERQRELAKVEETRSRVVNDRQIEKLEHAQTAQKALGSRLEILRQTLAQEQPTPQKLVDPNRAENPLVEKDTRAMSLVEAYDLARELENAVTESFKDLKATQTAIEHRMSFTAAQKITDVAKAVRLTANREAIEQTPRTKPDLDRQKEAEAEVVREADNIVEATVAMMNEAMEIVQGQDDRHGRQPQSKAIRWMEKKDFEARASEEEQMKRFKAMQAAADFAVAIQSAAAEDESQKAKDLTQVVHEDIAEVVKNTENADKPGHEKPKSDDGWRVEPPPLTKSMPELLPGNILNLAGDALNGLPAKWMYVNSWYVIGPFPNPNRVNLRRKFPPESVVDLDATYVGKDGRVVRWEFMQARSTHPRDSWRSEGKAETVPFTAEEYGIWYAFTEIVVDRDCDRWIAVGSDDRSDVWVNDQPVWGSSNKLKSWNIAEGYRRIHLNKGKNRILARIENGWHSLGWSLCISVEDEPVKP